MTSRIHNLILGLLTCAFVFFCANACPAALIEEKYQSPDGERALLVIINWDLYAVYANPDGTLNKESPFGQYITDLEAEKFRVFLSRCKTSATATALREHMNSFYRDHGIEGCVFVGALPNAAFEAYNWSTYLSFPSDLFYMEMDGRWLDRDGNGRFDTLASEMDPDVEVDLNEDIGFGRLTAHPITHTILDEVGLLNNYFFKNHAYRTGALTLNRRALQYVDNSLSNYGSSIALAYPDKVTTPNPQNSTVPDYKLRLKENYEFIQLVAHSAPTIHQLGGAYIYSSDIRDVDPTALFYGLLACSPAKYDAANYMAGQDTFSYTYGLETFGSSATMWTEGQSGFYGYYRALSTEARKNFGEAFKNNNNQVSMTLIGDPTLSLDPPRAYIDPTSTNAIEQGQTAHFIGFGKVESGSIVDYSWRSSLDGQLSTQPEFSTSILSAGEHIIYFKVNDDYGRWSSEATRKVSVLINGNHLPAAKLKASPISGSIPMSITFDASASSDTEGPLTNYVWEFGDGTNEQSAVAIINHFYTTAGSLTATVTVTDSAGATSSASVNLLIRDSYALPSANFTAKPTVGYGPLAVDFIEDPTSHITSRLWTFGDGGTATTQNPTRTYNAAGNYTVNFKATNAAGSVNETKTNLVTIWPVESDFVYNTTSALVGKPIQFVDISKGYAATRKWDFGDNTTATAKNVAHSYATIGNYTVSLTINDTKSTSTKTKINCVHVFENVTANFTVTPNSGTAPLTVQFTDTSSGNPNRWYWYIQNYSTGIYLTSQEQHPLAVIGKPGIYSVQLYAQNNISSNGTINNGILTVAAASNNSIPAAPFSFRANTQSKTSISLSWQDNSNNEQGFKIERSQVNDSQSFVQVATASAFNPRYPDDYAYYQNTGLAVNTTYYYRIRAYNAYGNSSYTQVAQAKTLANALPAPAAPSNLQAIALSSRNISLTWQDNSNNEIQFGIYRSNSSSGPFDWSCAYPEANATSAYDGMAITPGATYYYRANAYNEEGTTSSYSNIANVTTPLAAPGHLATTSISSSQINLAWQDNNVFEAGFKLERKLGESGSFTEIASLAANIVSYNNTGLVANNTYYYRIKAYSSKTVSDYSNIAVGNTFITIPEAPSNLVAKAIPVNHVSLRWQNNAINVKGIKIERGTNSEGPYSERASLDPSAVSYEDLGVSGGTTYYYRIYAFNDHGNSGYSNIVSAKAGTLATINLTGNAVRIDQINLAWTDTALEENGFTIERANAAAGPFSQIGSAGVNATQYSSTGLNPNTNYYFRVRAYDRLGFSDYSNVATIKTLDRPPAPLNLFANTVNTTSISLDWQDTINDTGYKIERSTSATSGFAQIATTPIDVVSFTSANCTANTTYYFRVRANTTIGESYYSSIASANTTGVPPVAEFSATPITGEPPLSVQFTDGSSGNITTRLWNFGDSTNSTLQNPLHNYTGVGNYTVRLTVTGAGGSNTRTKENYITVILNQTLYNLTLTITGEGTVTKNPDQQSYAAGSQVMLTAVPVEGNILQFWGQDATGNDNPLTITMTSQKQVTATFRFVYGNVDQDIDHEISAYDAARAARGAVGLDTLSEVQIRAADVDGSFSVDAYDAALIAQRVVGLIDEFPVER